MRATLLSVVVGLTLMLILPVSSLAQFGSLSGTVTDEATVDPIAGAAITLSGLYCVWYTDAQGQYFCDSIPSGAYWVTAYAEGYFPETYPESVIVFPGENTPDIDFALTYTGGGTGSISGRVTDEVTGLAIAGATIGLSNLDCDCVWYTDSAGYYVCDHIPPGLYLVFASAAGYHPETYPDSVMVIAGQDTPNIDFVLTPLGETGSISGWVTDEETGGPLPMAHVWAYDSIAGCAGSAWSDTSGYYFISNLLSGHYVVAVHKDGYQDEVYPELVPVEEGQNTPEINFALTPLGGPEFGSISGRVTDQQTGHPIMMAAVTITGIYGVWHTDTAGYYFCDNIPPGGYQVQASKDGYIPETYPDSVVVFPGENTPNIDFALRPEMGHGSITGRVTDEVTGLPIIMAHVRAIGLDNYCYGEAWSDTGGYYGIMDLCPGIYQVIASKPGYAPEIYPDSVLVIAGQNTPNIDLALSPLGEYGSISGLVTDESTGAHIASAHLIAVGLDNWCYAEAWSDTDGFYMFPELCPGAYELRAEKPGYIPETYPEPVIVVAGQNTPHIDFALTPEGGPEFGSISGRVTDEATGLPIIMAHVIATGVSHWTYEEAWTDSSGYYMIRDLCPDAYFVNAAKPGYVPEIYPDSVIVMPGQNTPDIDFALTPEGGPQVGAISGWVTDEVTGEPIVMAEITVGWLDCVWFTDSAGYYLCDGLPPDSYEVNARKPGYVPETYPELVPVHPGDTTTNINFALTPMGEPGSISGMVTDANSGAPIPYAHVWAHGEFDQGQAVTDSSGRYTITDLFAGDYFVNAWASEYHPQDYPTPVTVVEGQNTPGIDFVLIPLGGPGEGVIAGTVLEDTTYYQPIPYAMVFAVSWNGNWGFDETDSSGMYMIEGLHPDDYYVFALAPGYMGEFYDGVYSWQEATLVTPDAYDIDFHLAPCGYGEGRISGVIDSEGLPLEGASVYAYLGGQVAGYARSSSGGGYVINGLVPGTYTVSASMVSYYDAAYPDPVEVAYGKASGVNIELVPVQVGDVTGEGVVDLGDIVFLINYLYQGGQAPNPMQAGDLNCDGVVNVGDIVYFTNYLYKGGPAPCSP